jgi:AmmeMemoRadiSam system protein B
MTFALSGIVPHSPILRDTIGKENTKKLSKTLKSFQKLENNLFQIEPETIIVVAPHGNAPQGHFLMNINKDYHADYKDFGDFTPGKTYTGDIPLMNELGQCDRQSIIQLQIASENTLPFSITIPLELLTPRLPLVKIVPIFYEKLEPSVYLTFGQYIKNVILETKKKIVFLVSADLSHCLAKESPGGYNEKGKIFDQTIRYSLQKDNLKEITELPNDLVSSAGECGYGAIVTLIGVLNDMRYEIKVLSYECPFGIGYLVATIQ